MSWNKQTRIQSDIDGAVQALKEPGVVPFELDVLGTVAGHGLDDNMDFFGPSMIYDIRRLRFGNVVILEQMVRNPDCDADDVIVSRQFIAGEEPKTEDWPLEVEIAEGTGVEEPETAAEQDSPPALLISRLPEGGTAMPKQTPKFWMVVKAGPTEDYINGSVRGPYARIRHRTRASAYAEAERLAKKEGQNFIVLEALDEVVVIQPPTPAPVIIRPPTPAPVLEWRRTRYQSDIDAAKAGNV